MALVKQLARIEDQRVVRAILAQRIPYIRG